MVEGIKVNGIVDDKDETVETNVVVVLVGIIEAIQDVKVCW